MGKCNSKSVTDKAKNPRPQNLDCHESSLYKGNHKCTTCGHEKAIQIDCLEETEWGTTVESLYIICPKCQPILWFAQVYFELFEEDSYHTKQELLERLRENENHFWLAIANMEVALEKGAWCGTEVQS